MTKLIDADEVVEIIKDFDRRYPNKLTATIVTDFIEQYAKRHKVVAEPIQIFQDGEIIHCRDCDGEEYGRCKWWPDMLTVPENGYCFQAERKEE